MSAKHTPGPWKDDGGTIAAADGSFVAQLDLTARVLRSRPRDTAERMKTDGRLIAAAPDLLAFARWIEEYASNVDGLVFEKLRTKAREAIAKAEGTPPRTVYGAPVTYLKPGEEES